MRQTLQENYLHLQLEHSMCQYQNVMKLRTKIIESEEILEKSAQNLLRTNFYKEIVTT